MKVLILEDDMFVQRAYRLILPTEIDAQIVSCPKEGFEVLKTFSPDLIISDWEMPEMDGGQFCQELRKIGNTVPVVIVSGIDRSSHISICGANAALLKPFTRDSIVSLFSQLVKS